MHDALMLLAAMAASVAGMGWLALAMEVHWTQAFGTAPLTPSHGRALRVLGTLGLAVSLALCLAVDHASMASLVWVMTLAAAALLVAATLSWQARWLRLLAPWAWGRATA